MDIWKHGKYIDTWSLVHFLSGALIASGLFGMTYTFWQAFIISSVAIVAWEVYEWLTEIIEPGANVAVDLAVGGAGFLVGSACHYSLGKPFDLLGFLILLALTLALSLWGFLDYQKRGYR